MIWQGTKNKMHKNKWHLKRSDQIPLQQIHKVSKENQIYSHIENIQKYLSQILNIMKYNTSAKATSIYIFEQREGNDYGRL